MNPEHRINQLAEKYIDELLTEEESKELNHLLQSSPEARQVFLTSTHFNSLINESFYQKAEDIDNHSEIPHRNHWNSFLALAACVIFGFSLNSIFKTPTSVQNTSHTSHFLAQVTHAADVTNAQLKEGHFLKNSLLSLEHGVIEVSLFNGAQLTIQGPAQVLLHSLQEIELQHGLISVEIPEDVNHFTILTPSGKIQSSVSTFGVKASGNGEVETYVFEGKVSVLNLAGKQMANVAKQEALRISSDQVTSISLSSTAFPGMRGNSDNLIPSGNFENGVIVASQKFPSGFQQLSGDISRTVGEDQGIHPFQGTKMLRFQQTYNSSTPEESKYLNSSSQVFCFIDLNEHFPKGVPAGSQLIASCRVNRIAGDEQTDNRFNLRLSVLNELPNGVDDTIDTHYDSTASRSIDTDANPNTWENLSVRLEVNPMSRFVSLEVSALENIFNDTHTSDELDGHYLDDLNLTLLKPPTPAPLLVSSI
jgi:hypothetical protein